MNILLVPVVRGGTCETDQLIHDILEKTARHCVPTAKAPHFFTEKTLNAKTPMHVVQFVCDYDPKTGEAKNVLTAAELDRVLKLPQCGDKVACLLLTCSNSKKIAEQGISKIQFRVVTDCARVSRNDVLEFSTRFYDYYLRGDRPFGDCVEMGNMQVSLVCGTSTRFSVLFQ